MTTCVLIVEDDIRLRDLFARQLGEAGYDTVVAGGAEEAKRALATREIDLVATDILMENGDGLELLITLRREYPEIRSIAFTGCGNQLYLDSAKGLGADSLLEKPFSATDLIREVEQLLETT
ncbi:MAG: response regulator [Planctomycetota bacterium]